MRKGLTKNIFYGFFFGILLGITLSIVKLPNSFENIILDLLNFGGDIFLKTIKMLVVPIVFFSIVNGVANLSNINSLGRIGFKSIFLYLTTTFLAITISLILANFFNPGKGVNFNVDTKSIDISDPPSFLDIILNIIPSNPFQSLVNGEMLQVIFFSILLGSAISLFKNNSSLKKNFNDLNDVVMKILSIVMVFAPIGIFCLISKTFATQGLLSILELFKYFILVIVALITHLLIVYLPIIKFYGNINILKFFSGLKDALIFSFSTSSSSATIPITLSCLKKNFALKDNVASFTVPLGATINMDGTAIMQGIATVFIANLYGIDLILSDYVSIILTATLASVGTAGVPGVGIIMLGMVLGQVGLPLEGIAIVMGVDRFLDMLRTSLNISGDAMVSIVVNKGEN